MIGRKAVLRALLKLQLSGLPDYGRYPKDPEGLALMAETYAEVLQWRGVLPATLGPAVMRLAASGGAFPSAAELADACQAVRRDMFALVAVPSEKEDGRVALKEVPRQRVGALGPAGRASGPAEPCLAPPDGEGG